MEYEVQLAAYVTACRTALEECCGAYLQPGSRVSEAVRYSLLGGGKRVRGVLTLATAQLLGGALPAEEDGTMGVPARFAAAVEMVHAFSLIHDDLPCMDNDDMRRGKPACHIAYDEATAMLAGDVLAILPFEVIADAAIQAQWCTAAARLLAKAAGACGMIYGQELDLRYEHSSATEEQLQLVDRHKTGALITAAVQLGVVAAGRRPEEEPGLTEYAACIGLAFQLVDDVLDYTASEAELGKPVGSDKAQGKATYVGAVGLDGAKGKALEVTGQAVRALEPYGEAAAFLQDYANALARRVR